MRSRLMVPVLVVALLVAVAIPPIAAAEGVPQPFTREGNSAAFEEAILEEFPDAVFPARERIVCSSGEHSFYGPMSYCIAEFTTAGSWNLAEGSRGLLSPLVVYGHTSWRREWRRCPLGSRIPGKLFANDACGVDAPEQPHPETDADLVSLRILPKLRSGRPIRSAERFFLNAGTVPFISHFRASRKGDAYTFTNALGDSFRYRP